MGKKSILNLINNILHLITLKWVMATSALIDYLFTDLSIMLLVFLDYKYYFPMNKTKS